MGKKAWAIYKGPSARFSLSKSNGDFEYEPNNSDRTDEFKADHRFPTVHAAFAFLKKWKEQEKVKMRELGWITLSESWEQRKL